MPLGDVEEILRNSGLSDSDFSSESHKYAVVIRELFWELAKIFAQSSGGECELTHSEYSPPSGDQEKGKIDLCMDFFDTNGNKTSIVSFGAFLRDRIEFIPKKLREMFDVYVGFNYGDRGGFVVSGSMVSSIEQEQYESIRCEGRIGYIHGKGEELERFSENLQSFLGKKMSN